MLKLTTAAAVLAFVALPMTAFAAAPTDGAFQVANVAPPEEPPPPATPPATPAADPAAPTVNDAPPVPETPPAPADPLEATPPEAVEGGPPSTGPAPEVPDAAAAVTEAPAETASGGSNMGMIVGVIAFLVVAAGAGYWFMNRKA